MKTSLIMINKNNAQPEFIIEKKQKMRYKVINENDIEPIYRAMARYIEQQLKRNQPVHIPAMNSRSLGQLLCCLKSR